MILKSCKICIFYKGVKPWFWSKIWSFFNFTFLGQIDQKESFPIILMKMSFSRLKIVDITKLQNFYFFTKGLVQTSGQKIEVSWPCFFWLNLLKERVQKRSWHKNLFYTTNKLIFGGWKICTFCKGVSPWF